MIRSVRPESRTARPGRGRERPCHAINLRTESVVRVPELSVRKSLWKNSDFAASSQRAVWSTFGPPGRASAANGSWALSRVNRTPLRVLAVPIDGRK